MLVLQSGGTDLSTVTVNQMDNMYEKAMSVGYKVQSTVDLGIMAFTPSEEPNGYNAYGTKGGSNTGWKSADLLDELANSGVKYNPDDVLAVTKNAEGKLVWLENGNSKAGMEHILEHADDFARKGISQDKIKDLVMESITNGKIVRYQGKGTGRPIYQVIFEGKTYNTAITVGNNGFIVGANPTTLP